MLTVRELKTPEAKQAFKRLQEQAINAGMKTNLPKTITQYRKDYTGTKSNASSDYYYEWSREIGKFFNRLGARAEKVIEKNNLDMTPRTEFNRIEKRGLSAQFDIYTSTLRTLKNVTNPNYLKGDMTEKQRDELIKKTQTMTVTEDGKTTKKPIVTKAGLRSTKRKPVTLATFGGSSVRLAYNNFLVALSELGYTKSLNKIISMTPNEWYAIFKENEGDIDLVYKYRDVRVSDDDIIYSMFSGEPLEDDTGLEYEDEFD